MSIQICQLFRCLHQYGGPIAEDVVLTARMPSHCQVYLACLLHSSQGPQLS